MTPGEQMTFVRELSKTIADDICKQIEDGKVPDDWDGHELRELLAYRHRLSARMSNLMGGRSRRYRAFLNAIGVNNL